MTREEVRRRIEPAKTFQMAVDPTVSQLERWLVRLRLPLRWEFWGALTLLLTLGAAAGSGVWLLHQPTKPESCQGTFWPFASASFRLYCAQQAAEKQHLEELLWAIHLVNDLPTDHPLRPEINRQIEIWATQVLNLAEETFHQGDLERAITFAEQIPTQTSAHLLVEGRVARWQEIWDQGEIIYKRTVAELKQEDWRRAFHISLGLMEVDSRYWSDTQFAQLNQRIIAAQEDDKKLAQARRLFREGSLESLVNALTIAQGLAPTSDFLKSAQRIIDNVSRELLGRAETALERQELQEAISIAQNIPQTAAIWPEARDFLTLAEAESWTWGESIPGIEEAIKRAQTIATNRPLYQRSQSLIGIWREDIKALKVMAKAQQLAFKGGINNLQQAIATAQQVPANLSPYRQRATQEQINTWGQQILIIRDRPVLDEAQQLAATNKIENLRQAINLAASFSSRHPLYDEAQTQLRYWQDQLQALLPPPVLPSPSPLPDGSSPQVPAPIPAGTTAPSPQVPQLQPPAAQQWVQQARAIAEAGTPTALAQATLLINQVPVDSPLRAEAEQAMTRWSRAILDLANQQAIVDRPKAIAIARQVPQVTSVYNEAQSLIQSWQAPPPPQTP